MLEPKLAPAFLSKLDIDYAYICIQVFLEFILYVSFLVLRASSTDEHLIRFHLPITMG